MDMDQLPAGVTRNRPPRREVLVGVGAAIALAGLDVGVAQAEANPVVAIDAIGSFEILSYSWLSSAKSTQGGVSASKAGGVAFVKYIDQVSPALNTAAAAGTTFAAATLTVTAKNGKPVRYEMTEVFVASYVAGAGTPTPTESVSLRFIDLKVVRR